MKTTNGRGGHGVRADGHPYLRTGDVARILDVTARTVARLIDDGSLPGRIVPMPGKGSERRVRAVDLVPYLRSNGYKDEADALADQYGFRPAPVLLVGMSSDSAVRNLIDALNPYRPVQLAASVFGAGLAAGASPPAAVVWDLSLGLGECVGAAAELGVRPGVRQLALAHGEQAADSRLAGGPFGAVLAAPVAVDRLVGLLLADDDRR